MTINLDTVGRAIEAQTRAWTLAFPAEIEARFEAETAEERCRKLILHNYVGLGIYNAFLAGDFLLVHDVFIASVCLHLLVMTPIMAAVIAILTRRPPVWLREGILAGGIVLTTLAILGLMVVSRSPLRGSEHISVVLVILFATTVQRIRFAYVLGACLACLGLYVCALSMVVDDDPARILVADTVFAGVVLFSLIGCYNLEREQRTGYLLALRDQLRHDELDAISHRDALTGTGNRRALDRAMEQRTRPTADAAPTAVLLCDIDSFKIYNDENGHLAGDVCLEQIAALIGNEVRGDRDGRIEDLPADRVFRFGGEEFLVLLDGLTLGDAIGVGERLRSAVEAAGIARHTSADSERGAVMTVSVGVAVGLVSARFGMSDLIAEADRALYAAKRGGRNQVQPRRDQAPTAARAA